MRHHLFAVDSFGLGTLPSATVSINVHILFKVIMQILRRQHTKQLLAVKQIAVVKIKRSKFTFRGLEEEAKSYGRFVVSEHRQLTSNSSIS